MARTLLRWLIRGIVLACGLVAAAAAALWVWSGSEGSLAAALRWAGAHEPLTAEGVAGSLRHGGTAARLAWRSDGLAVDVRDAELRWRARDLLHRRLFIQHLSARRIQIENHGGTSASENGAPPASLALPLAVGLEQLHIGELLLPAAAGARLTNVDAHYDYDGTRHELVVEHLGFQDGTYSAQARLSALAPLTLDATLGGTLAPELPSLAEPLPLAVQATIQGPLAHLRLQAEVHATPADAPEAAPQASATARIRPWAAQPLDEAHATLRHFDLARLWPAAPRTRLSGDVGLSPAHEPADGFAIAARLANADPGPWDSHRLPVQSLQAEALWHPGGATVRTLQARVAGGSLHAEGDWRAPSPSADAAGWRLQARLEGVNPAELHTQLAARPMDGSATASGSGEALRFEAALKARAPGAAPAHKGPPGTPPPLGLREASARGQFADGLLTLDHWLVASDDAQAGGRAQLQWHDGALAGGQADMTARAPGMTAELHGRLRKDTGAGTLQWQVGDAAQALAWLGRLPGAAALLPAHATARGQARLSARWGGGWGQPELQARLASTALTIHVQDQPAIELRQADAQLDGTLAQARLTLQAQAAQGERRAQVRLALNGGRAAAQPGGKQHGWHARLSSLALDLTEPSLGPDPWRLALNAPVAMRWTGTAPGGWTVDAGSLAVTSPAPQAQATLRWGEITHASGRLNSKGQLTGLPLQWVERALGTTLRDQGLTGDVMLEGAWNLARADTLQLKAELARASGDLMLYASESAGAPATRIAAGLREARATLTSDGRDLALQLRWDSAHAGQVSGELRSTLTSANGAAGAQHLSWPEDAPLHGQLHARLPKIAAWSALAPPGWRLGGSLAVDVDIAGTRAAPRLSGTATADDLALRSIVDGFQLDQGRLRARFADTRLMVDELSLHGAGEHGGELRARGEAGWADGRLRARLEATLQQLHPSLLSDRDLTLSGQLQAALQDKALSASGQLRIDHALIELPDESRPTLGGDVIVPDRNPAAQGGGQAQAKAASPSLTAHVDVAVDLGSDFRVRGMGADTRLAGQLRLTSSGPLAQMPQVSGLVQARDGHFHAYGQNLDIARGDIRFTGAVDNPALDIIALRPNFTSDQKVGVQVSGNALLPRISLYSEPALPDSQTLAWLLLGRAAPANGAESAMLQSAALALLGGKSGRGLASRFGLDELSVARDDSGAVANTSITLGKRLSDRLYAAYEHSLAGTGSTLLVFYELSRRWSLRGQAGENAALDLIYRLSFD